MFDAAGHLQVIEVLNGEVVGRNELAMQKLESLSRARWVLGAGIDVLICGAISRPLEAMLTSAGVDVIPRRCGKVEDVLAAFVSGQLTEQAFLMPGCRRRRWRGRGSRPHTGGRGRARVNAQGR